MSGLFGGDGFGDPFDNPFADRAELAEEGRRLASQRDDLIAQGVDPDDLLVPLHPDDAA